MPQDKRRLYRSAQFESFESRIVFSAEPLGIGVQGELDPASELMRADQQIQWSLAEAHEATGVNYVFEDYGFDGAGQTVVVIDSGIAWDHYAFHDDLGGGLGNSSVVGGWDFAENDANPYDDGPAGYHGTHVAGIVGSRDAIHRGVAPGVDLIGLRVFDDNGHGTLQWVEQALDWVHENRAAFENPITTVNLSLGVEWNAHNLPEWATLEDEFAQLEADGIFISVAAGNSFAQYGQSGLSYPAVSNFVVPVASYDADGNFSDFSQRNGRVLVAPGESIRSAVPDHLFGGAQTNQYLGASGTSMAAPYVAGASAILRQAFQFMGQDNVTQDALYHHFRQTADRFYDAVTGGTYHRINLAAAINAVVHDAHSGAAASATWIGNVVNGAQIEGTIGKFNDVDAFSFTASASGVVTLTLDTTHDLEAVLKLNHNLLSIHGNQVTFQVQANQNYTLTLSTADGIGHYGIDLDFDPAVAAVDLGTVASTLLQNQSVTGETWYQVTAARDGLLTSRIQAPGLQIEIYDQSLHRIGSAVSSAGLARSDVAVDGGNTYYIKVSGNATSFDLRLDNLVSLHNGKLSVFGTFQNDVIAINTQHGVEVTVNSVSYEFSANQVQNIKLRSFAGNDSLRLQLGDENDTINLTGGQVQATNSQLSIASDQFSRILVFAGGGQDKAIFQNTAGNDHFEWKKHWAQMRGAGYINRAFQVETITAFGGSGHDTAKLHGGDSDERISFSRNKSYLGNSQFQVSVHAFDNVAVHAGGGMDSLVIHGSAGNDNVHLTGRSSHANLAGARVSAAGVEHTRAFAGGGHDVVRFYDSDADDRLVANPSQSTMRSGHYENQAVGFDQVFATADSGRGNDVAHLYDSAGNDRYRGDHYRAELSGNGFSISAMGFERQSVIASNGGVDHAVFVGTRGQDVMYSTGTSTWVWGTTYHTGLIGFEQTRVDGNGGSDAARFQGDHGDDQFSFADGVATMQRSGNRVSVEDFSRLRINGGGGSNSLVMSGFDENDHLHARGSALQAYLDGVNIDATDFVWMEATTDDGHGSHQEIDAVDFWYALHGQWQ